MTPRQAHLLIPIFAAYAPAHAETSNPAAPADFTAGVLPLVALFIATCFGLKNGALLAFQKRHTSTVKFALAGLFLILAGVIFFGV